MAAVYGALSGLCELGTEVSFSHYDPDMACRGR